MFDFNRAPYFQSFVEVRVEASKSRVVFALIGVDGPLRWRDVQVKAAIVRRAHQTDAGRVRRADELTAFDSSRSAAIGSIRAARRAGR